MGGEPGRRREWTLEGRLVLVVLVVNLLLFGAASVFSAESATVRQRWYAHMRLEALALNLPRGAPNERLASLLRYPLWDEFQDAVFMDRRYEFDEEDRRVIPSVLACSPLGVLHREPDFDEQAALQAIVRAIETGSTIHVRDNDFAIPLTDRDGEVWGGLWYRTADGDSMFEVLQSNLPWFLLFTLLLTLAILWALRGLVIEPLERLAAGARRVGSGDYRVVLEPSVGKARELRDLARTFDDMTAELGSFNATLTEEVRVASEKARRAEATLMTQRRLAAMGELAAGIAHEINNPLGGLSNALDMLEREDLAPERRARYLGLLKDGLGRIGETVHRLRRFTPRAKPMPVELELRDTVQDAIDLVVHRAQGAQVEITLEARGSTRLFGARTELGQAILNLLTNSLDSLEERGRGGRIELILERQGDVVVLTATDDGPGVAREELESVADLFYTTKEVGKGTGLGLALVHNVVEAHGGTVSIDSEKDRYFQVTLAFPGARIDEEAASS